MRNQVDTSVEVSRIVSRNPKVHSGDLVFAGTRVPVSILVEYLKSGYSVEEFLENYPTVERWQVERFLDLSPEAIERLRAQSASVA